MNNSDIAYIKQVFRSVNWFAAECIVDVRMPIKTIEDNTEIHSNKNWYLCLLKDKRFGQFRILKLQPYKYKDAEYKGEETWRFGWQNEEGRNLYSNEFNPTFEFDDEQVSMYAEV